MRHTRTLIACAASAWIFLACSHVIGFPSVLPAEKPVLKTTGSVRLYMAPRLQEASYSFHAVFSGIFDRWVVEYGKRTHDFAEAYLSHAFTDYRELDSPTQPEDDRAPLVVIDAVGYYVQSQAAHAFMDVRVLDPDGVVIASKHYAGAGGSGALAVVAGGAYAQHEVTQISTDQALRKAFIDLVDDLHGLIPDESSDADEEPDATR